MATWFDKDRGTKSGRINPSVIVPHDGEYVFVLGSESASGVSKVSENDFTELRQTVDLSGVDLVSATMDTIGTLMSQHQPLAGFQPDPDTVFWFDFNVGKGPSSNSVSGGFQMEMNGQIESSKESYSPNGSYCKAIPEHTTISNMLGNNNPQSFPSSLPEWTLQWWMNFKSDSFLVSTGVNPSILSASTNLLGGIQVVLTGVAGLHKWEMLVKQHSVSVVENVYIDGFEIDEPLGWKLFTLRYKHSNSQPTQLELFINGSLSNQATTQFLFEPEQPNSPEDIVYGNKDLIGGIDDIRLIKRHLTNQEIEDSYNNCIENPDPLNYKWVMQILIDDRLFAERDIASNERRRWTDFYAPIRLLTGPHEVAFRLKLKAA